jgi:YggT family protein
MSRELEGRDRIRRDGGSSRHDPDVRREPATGAGATHDRIADEPLRSEDTLSPNRVEVERRGMPDRRVADHPVEVDNRVGDRRAAAEQARVEARERRYYTIGRVTQGVDYLFYLLYGLLATRFVLALLGANEQAGFVQFINGITNPFYAPFSGIVSRPAVNSGVLDFPLLIAILGYALLHLAVRGLLRVLSGARATP